MPFPGFRLRLRKGPREGTYLQPGHTRPLPDMPDRTEDGKEKEKRKHLDRSVHESARGEPGQQLNNTTACTG
jgi:hypothetical protein